MKRAAALRKDLAKKGYELICPTGPIKTLPADASSPTERDKLEAANDEDYPYWGWCTMDEEKEVMRGLDQSVAFLKTILETQGPFIGILGFSQGAAMAAYLASILEQGQSINHPPVLFFIAACGFRWRFKQYDQYYPINTPSLHLVGDLDMIVNDERTRRLIESCRNPVVIRHPGGTLRCYEAHV
jgi:predicted esterase